MEQRTTLDKNHLPLAVSPKCPPISSPATPLSSELKTQWRISVPLVAMNLTWFAKLAITTAFLGRLGELPLAGGTLGFTFANVTGFSVLNGLCGAMEPICGQAFGAKNFKLLHKTLLMSILLLLGSSLPIAFLWLNVDKILLHFGQEKDISDTAKNYIIYLLPDLLITSFLCPLKSYLSTQNVTVPIMLSSALGVALHVPVNMFLSKVKGLEGISMAVWITDLVVAIILGVYVLIKEHRKGGKWSEGGWFDQGTKEWFGFLKLAGPCCLTTLATCASVRVSNELGANRPGLAYRSAYVCICISLISGLVGASVMVAARGVWGLLFSQDKGILLSVEKMMMLMAVVEVVNFPLTVCGGIVRGTARPWLAMYANVCGFYLLALPLGVVLELKMKLGLAGLLVGFLVGMVACLVLILVFVAKIDWDDEANKAQKLACDEQEHERSQEAIHI